MNKKTLLKKWTHSPDKPTIEISYKHFWAAPMCIVHTSLLQTLNFSIIQTWDLRLQVPSEVNNSVNTKLVVILVFNENQAHVFIFIVNQNIPSSSPVASLRNCIRIHNYDSSDKIIHYMTKPKPTFIFLRGKRQVFVNLRFIWNCAILYCSLILASMGYKDIINHP